jgi:radical SAM protein with 4Fe4S-binding SPASM domain
VPDSGKKELSTQEVRSVFDQLVEAGCLHVTLTGGEPLMRKDIITLIDYARRIGLFIRLFTNATLITPPIADKLKELQLISLEISLHSLKRERFDWFTQVAGSYDRTMKALNLFKERMIKIALKINITRANLDEIGELKEFVEYLGAAPEWATVLMPRQDGSKDNITLRLEPESVVNFDAMLFPDLTRDVDPSLDAIPKSDNNPRGRWIRGRLFQCGAGKKGLAISPYGELKLCLELPAAGYSVLNGGLKEGWKMLGDCVRSFKPNPDNKCFDCRLRKFCSSCPAKARLECGDMNACPPYYRRLAELSRDKKTMDERR